MGIVIPEGALVGDSELVHWEEARNLTAVVTLPALDRTDARILLVLSANVGNSVIQVAAGLSPGSFVWKSFAWSIPDMNAVPPTYQWTLNASGPIMGPGDQVSLSLVRDASAWGYAVEDFATGKNVSGTFPDSTLAPLASGDQEVFAFESYTSNTTVLSDMGSVKLDHFTVDGMKVASGFYYVDGWNPAHHPLFVVGTTFSPGYVSLQSFPNGTFLWRYSPGWQASDFSGSSPGLLADLLVITAFAVAGLYVTQHIRSSRLRAVKKAPA